MVLLAAMNTLVLPVGPEAIPLHPGEVAHPPAAKNPLRSRRPSLKDRAISALFSKKAEPLTASTSLQAHSNDTRIQPAKVTAPGRAPSSKRKGPPSLQVENPVSTTLTSLATTTNKYQQPQPSNSDVDVSSIPSITVQPPSITGTLSGASTPRPNKRSSSKSAQERTLSAGSRHTTVYSVKGQNTPTATHLGRERTSERDSRGSFRTVRYPDESDSIVIIESPQSMTTGIPWDTEGISRHECESPLNVHHGLPTPKSVWNRAQLPLKLSTNSLHENRTPSNSHSKPDFRNAEPMESHVPPLTSRFSLDSHFTASSESYDGGHSTSPGSEHHPSSSGEALSQEGAFLARLASRRKRPIRSGVSKPAARTTNSHLNEDQWVGGFAPKPPAKPKERSSRTSDNAGYDPPPYQTTHRRILSH
ncbi:hypothetical protein M408DRAFT_230831 [Serendipita vermifera MAFF 305830]|uniref:Uncharacterized protein n=1 Tax=Serendipita vermifera MAFF 305830 TaxID=933852 RepID=A0A0C2X606_SERVB|nr:hypothetical protein M408DRAFT_230831 [Serendipita vermifera MAFF 305830]